jgi:toxic protein SymE
MREQNKPMKPRKLKVYSKYRQCNGRPSIVPEIRLCGKWLTQLGFKHGDMIALKSENQKIIIENVSNLKI